MSNNYGIISHDTLANIANAIREKANSNRTYYPDSMALAISQIRAGEGYIYPTAYGLHEYSGNISNNIINFDLRNSMPPLGEGDEYTFLGNVNYGNLYSKNIEFYEVAHSNGNYTYGLKCQQDEPANKISLINMDDLFIYCGKLHDAISGDFTMSMKNTYHGAYSIMNAACGPNVLYMDNCYESCYLLENAVCGNNVRTMKGAYCYASNIINGVSGPNVLDMTYAYSSCGNLQYLNIGNNVKNAAFVAYACQNLTTIFHEGNQLTNANAAFYGCTNLVNVVGTYNKVINANYMFFHCNNLVNAGHIFDLSQSVIEAEHAFENCVKIERAQIPNTLREASSMFYNCQSLNEVVGGPNVINAYQMFYNCKSLVQFIGLNNAINTYSTFSGCDNLVNVIGAGSNAINVQYMFDNCYNLQEPATLYDAVNMYGTYRFCYNLLNYQIPETAQDISNAFAFCNNLTGNVIVPGNVTVLGSAFNACDNICDVVIHSNNLLNTGWRQVNAFRRSVYDTIRHIVLTNLNSFNAFVYCNGAGNFTKTNETYAEPIELNIENNSYNVVRCSYNIQYNCYIYCTE